MTIDDLQKLAASLPATDELQERLELIVQLEQAMNRVKAVWNDDSFPTADELGELANEAARLNASLAETSELQKAIA